MQHKFFTSRIERQVFNISKDPLTHNPKFFWHCSLEIAFILIIRYVQTLLYVSKLLLKIIKIIFCISSRSINLISNQDDIVMRRSLDAFRLASNAHNGCRIYERRRDAQRIYSRKKKNNDSSLMSTPKYFSARYSAFRSVSWHLSIIDLLPLCGLQWVLRSSIG